MRRGGERFALLARGHAGGRELNEGGQARRMRRGGHARGRQTSGKPGHVEEGTNQSQ
jgi:hypothetical protein